MEKHLHAEHAWRVRVDGRRRGAGVLLDERHVLTCAHVVGDENERVSVRSAACRPEWSITARVAPGSWVYRGGDTRRGDVALLVLDEATLCDAHTRLWCAPISGGRVRAHGFPRAEPYGISVDAELAGDGGRGGEFGLLNRVRADGQWIEPGYSGAGVMVLDGDHAGRVIGIVVADFRNADAIAAWMVPTETIREYLPHVTPFVAGEPAQLLGSSEGGIPELERGDILRLALTRELTRLLSGGWAGTVVVPNGATGTGTGWLIRLVRTADPATRAWTSDAQFTVAPRDTVLGLGAIDAAYDARGRSLSEITHYLAERFGLPPDEPDLVRRLLRRVRPVCLVIVGIDRAESPDKLIRELLRPLAASARSRGVRLVLGFDGSLPGGKLPYEVALDPEPCAGCFQHSMTAADAEARVAELAAAEDDAARLSSENQRRFREPPTLPHARAPRLRVRLAVARVTEPNPELTAIYEEAVAALGVVASFTQKSRRLDERLDDLRQTLEVNRERATRYFGAEDQPLADRYDLAARAVWQAPIELAAARMLVERYIAEVERRIGEIGEDEKDHG
jgi:Trypsin-like peptidase domain